MAEQSLRPVRRKYLAVLGVLVTLGLGLALFYLVESGRLAAGNPVCSVCKRPLHPAQTFVVLSRDGKEHLTCCPRCGLRYAIENKGRVMVATDFSNGRRISADSAYYVEGSDVMECCNSSTMRADSGLICEMHYDRCMPSLVTFAEIGAAENFQRQHGGRVIGIAEAMQSVRQQITQ